MKQKKKRHDHVFVPHVGISVFGGTGTAWVDERFVSGAAEDQVRMQRCIVCGEQGYGVPL